MKSTLHGSVTVLRFAAVVALAMWGATSSVNGQAVISTPANNATIDGPPPGTSAKTTVKYNITDSKYYTTSLKLSWTDSNNVYHELTSTNAPVNKGNGDYEWDIDLPSDTTTDVTVKIKMQRDESSDGTKADTKTISNSGISIWRFP